MSHRRLHILVALLCTGLWAGAIWLGHTSGHLRFLDRLESALSDVRTLARGVKAPPDLVTIVAIDDTIVKLGGAYPLPRAEIAKIVEAIARLEPKVIAIDLLLIDKGPADGDAALAKSIAAHPTVLAAAAVFPNTVQPSAETDGPLARLPIGRPLPAAAPGLCRSRGSRHRQCSDGPDRHAAVGPDAVPDARQNRIVVSASRRLRRDRKAADDRARPPASSATGRSRPLPIMRCRFPITARAAPFAPSAPQIWSTARSTRRPSRAGSWSSARPQPAPATSFRRRSIH